MDSVEYILVYLQVKVMKVGPSSSIDSCYVNILALLLLFFCHLVMSDSLRPRGL